MPEYQGQKVTLNKPRRITKGRPSYGRKKFEVFVNNAKGNVVRVTFGDPNLSIKRDSDTRYWSCKFWQKGKKVSDLV